VGNWKEWRVAGMGAVATILFTLRGCDDGIVAFATWGSVGEKRSGIYPACSACTDSRGVQRRSGGARRIDS
jgi:hypothetical protein